MYTRLHGFKFKFSKIFWGGALWGGAHRAPSPDPSPDLSRAAPSVRSSPSIFRRIAPLVRASPSVLGRFAPEIRASPSICPSPNWSTPHLDFDNSNTGEKRLRMGRGSRVLSWKLASASSYGPVGCIFFKQYCMILVAWLMDHGIEGLKDVVLGSIRDLKI